MDVVVPLRDPLTLARIFRRRGEPRRSPRMLVGEESVSIEYPDVLDEPLVVPRSAIRVAAFDSEGRSRFPIHPGDKSFLWIHGMTALPAVPHDVPPNVALLFNWPVAGPAVRRSRHNGLVSGERVAGILLAAADARQAEEALAPLRVTRAVTTADAALVDQHLQAPAEHGGRADLNRPRAIRLLVVTIATSGLALLAAWMVGSGLPF